MKLGVCYYPEQWPEEQWAKDADEMVSLGLQLVRIGEFSWSRIESERNQFTWEWLDRAIQVLAARGLNIVLGSPTACPPRWLIDECPEILATDEYGNPRKFGSRRHYCFSSRRYREECERIVTVMAQRYGGHPAVVAWQTDNEYGCHETTLSYSKSAADAFRDWLAERYKSVEQLNESWGTVFWSQEYQSFGEIDPPVATVTEANPAHQLDYRRFASDEVVSFNQLQVKIIRHCAPNADVIHNFMGFSTDFDHHEVGRDLDVSTWDSYPLGFLEQGWFSEKEKQAYLRQGHPDFAAFHHDLYRGCSNGRMWVMEQQPGPVNWAPYNPAPLPGMVRTWTWEAFAHGAEVVSYFRWRQAPFGQEQMHSGLNLPNGDRDTAFDEVLQVAQELEELTITGSTIAPVALVWSYQAQWITQIQPQGENFSSLIWAYTCYSVLREIGLDVDIVSPQASLEGYQLVVCPCLPTVDESFPSTLASLDVPVLLGMRTGSKTENYQIPRELPPGPLSSLIPLKVSRVESLRPGASEAVVYEGKHYQVEQWLEWVDSDLLPLASTEDGKGVWFHHNKVHYLATWPEPGFLREVMLRLCKQAGLAVGVLPEGARSRRLGDLQFVFNYNNHAIRLPDNGGRVFRLGQPEIPAGGIAAYKIND